MPDRDPVQVRLLRTWDLLDLRLEAHGCTIEPGDDGALLVAGPDAVVILHFPPQHLGEEAHDAGDGTILLPDPAGSQHRAAGPSRIVYGVPEGMRIAYSLPGILEALNGLPLRVSENATPPGESSGRAAYQPDDLETAIEAPYRLIVSPSAKESFAHEVDPVGPAGRPELWRTRLVAPEGEPTTVRALWARNPDDPDPFPQSLTSNDRIHLMQQTFGGPEANADTPLEVANLQLSTLGAWFDWKQSWDFPAAIVDYRHQSFMGRDGYVRVVTPGILFPFGHRCYLVRITEREIKHRDNPKAALWQRRFLIVRQPSRSYDAGFRDNPFAQVTISPLVTPDLEKPPDDDTTPFVPHRAGAPFPFTLTTVDRGGDVRTWAAPLAFVPVVSKEGRHFLPTTAQASSTYFPVRVIPGRGQSISVAPPVKAGDTAVEAVHLVFDGEIDQRELTARPFLTEMRGVLPSMRHLAPQAPQVDLVLAKPYLADGLPARLPGGAPVPGTPNAGELILALKGAPAAVDFSSRSDRSGGFVAPNLPVRGVSRALGAIGESGDVPSPFDAGTFDPTTFLAGALPKLFGLFRLDELIEATGLDQAPAFVTDALDAVATMQAEATRLRAALDTAHDRLAGEVAQGAHGGAVAVAQGALTAVDAAATNVRNDLDALLTALPGIVADPGAVSAAANALPPHLDQLAGAIALPGVPAAVRAALVKPVEALRALAELATTVEKVEKELLALASAQVTARLHWQPDIQPWGLAGIPNIFVPNDKKLTIDVEVRASAKAPPAVDVLAELVDFDLNLVGDGATALMGLNFRRVAFHAGSTGKPEIDVVFGGMEFLGPLAFVERLRELIPFDGFSDPPYVDVTAEGATAGFDLALPNVSVGVFSLENIALGADARVPFLGDAMSVGFHFCSKDAPFRLTVMCVGGGGWLVLRAAPKGLVLLELGLEACASLSVDLGVASGSVSIAVGVYLRLEADKGLLTAYFRIRGEVDVLGLISASITLELSLTYDFVSGKLTGRASLVVEIDILFFSASVEIVVERRLAGSKGDPTMFQIMPPDPTGMNSDWARYCDAFAPVPA